MRLTEKQRRLLGKLLKAGDCSHGGVDKKVWKRWNINALMKDAGGGRVVRRNSYSSSGECVWWMWRRGCDRVACGVALALGAGWLRLYSPSLLLQCGSRGMKHCRQTDRNNYPYRSLHTCTRARANTYSHTHSQRASYPVRVLNYAVWPVEAITKSIPVEFAHFNKHAQPARSPVSCMVRFSIL